MRRAFWLIMVLACTGLVGCGTQPPQPTASTSPSAPAALLPLPANIAGIPGPGDAIAILQPNSPAGELEIGVPRDLTLGHCGLISPLDFDGSLWDPIAGDDGAGGPLTDEQIGELINATPVIVTLVEPNVSQLRTPSGAVITLERNIGPRAYFLCD